MSSTFAAPIRRAFSVLSFGAFVACGADSVGPEIETLEEAQALWARTRPASGNYTFSQQVACFCPTGGTVYHVTVRAGLITRVHDPKSASDLPTGQFSQFRTVDQLFDEVRSALSKTGVLTDVAYDPTMGFPTTVSLDPIKNAVDDEVAYLSTNVQASS